MKKYQESGELTFDILFDLAYERVKQSPEYPFDRDEVSVSNGDVTTYLGKMTCYTSYNHCLVHVYSVVLDEPSVKAMRFRDGEIQGKSLLIYI